MELRHLEMVYWKLSGVTFDMPQLLEAPQEFAPGLDKDLLASNKEYRFILDLIQSDRTEGAIPPFLFSDWRLYNSLVVLYINIRF
jgi:hypothetical protein